MEILKQIWQLRVIKGEQLVVLDAPLLFESKILAWICHPIITVAITDKDKQRERLMNRNKALTKKEADAKIDS